MINKTAALEINELLERCCELADSEAKKVSDRYFRWAHIRDDLKWFRLNLGLTSEISKTRRNSANSGTPDKGGSPWPERLTEKSVSSP